MSVKGYKIIPMAFPDMRTDRADAALVVGRVAALHARARVDRQADFFPVVRRHAEDLRAVHLGHGPLYLLIAYSGRNSRCRVATARMGPTFTKAS